MSTPRILFEPGDPQAGLAFLTVNRPEARNAMNHALAAATVHAIETCQDAAAIVLTGADPAFCAGLDLSELSEHSVAGGIEQSRSWHELFDLLQFGRAPVIALHRASSEAFVARGGRIPAPLQALNN